MHIEVFITICPIIYNLIGVFEQVFLTLFADC